MKKITIALICFCCFNFQNFTSAQDSITIQDLEKFTYPFTIEDGKFYGAGAELLTKAIAETHITMLGENVGSKLEHQFTNALKMFADELFDNLTPKNKQIHQQLYNETITFLDEHYKTINAHNSDEVYPFMSKIKSSKTFNNFLEQMTVCEENKNILKEIENSIEYYWMYGNKKFYEKNIWCAKQDKLNLPLTMSM